MRASADRDESAILRKLEEEGKFKIVAALYDVKSGLVTWLGSD